MFFTNHFVTYKWERPGEGHFLYYMMLENREVQNIMTEFKSVTKSYFKGENQDIPGLTRRLRLLVEKAEGLMSYII